MQATYDKYIAMREELGRSETTDLDGYELFSVVMSVRGRLDDMEVSDEINACSVEIEVGVDGIKGTMAL